MLDSRTRERLVAQLDGVIVVLQRSASASVSLEKLKDARLLLLGEKPENLERNRK